MFKSNHLKLAAIISCSVVLTACSGDDDVNTTSPSVTLTGDSVYELLAGETYSEPGVTAVDSLNNTLTVNTEGVVDSTTVGTYTLTYTAYDSDGNSTSIYRTITILPSIILNIQSKDYFTGSVIEGTDISISSSEDGVAIIRTGVTDSEGEVAIPVAEGATRIIVSGDAVEYGEYSDIVSSIDQVVDLFLQPINAGVEFTPSQESTLTVSGLNVISLPADALADENDNKPTGNVSAEITIIDPSVDPSLMPGNFETVNNDTGEAEQIESFGAINVTFDDSEGNRLNLADGQTATIRIPLASAAIDPPSTIPLYYFDEDSGYWNEEGSATLTNNEYYEGTVSHFSTWNADILYESVQISGCIEDSEQNPVYLADVKTQGVDYSGQAWATSDTEGKFIISAKSNSTVYLSATTEDGLSRTTTITTDSNDLVQDECIALEESAAVVTLTWGENPADLDTQFFGPSSDSEDTTFLMYYSNTEVVLNGSSIWLDVDDVSSYGPEITTISSFPYAGRYSYAVNHFSGSSDIAASPARVELEYAGHKTIFSAPEGDATTCWAVFDFVVDESGNVTIDPVNTWEDSFYCNGNNEVSDEDIEYIDEGAEGISAYSLTTVTSSRNTSVSNDDSKILKDMIESKYYVK
jgi:hypothetical protein